MGIAPWRWRRACGPGARRRRCLRRRSVRVENEDRLGGAGQGNGTTLAALLTADAGAGPEGDVAAVEAGELRDTKPSLHGDEEQCPVSPALPLRPVGTLDEGVDLSCAEERHDGHVEPCGRDGKNPLDEGGVLGVTQ